MDSLERRLAPNSDVVARRLGDDTVLVNLRTNRIFQLNRTGTAFWELLEQGCDRVEIETRLASRFDVEDARLGAEIDRLVARLDRDGLLRTNGRG